MLVSGFIDGELIYVLEFPFRCRNFVKNLHRQLNRRFPRGDRSNEFLRSATFSFEHYKNCGRLRFVYLNRNSLGSKKKHLTGKFFDFLAMHKQPRLPFYD